MKSTLQIVSAVLVYSVAFIPHAAYGVATSDEPAKVVSGLLLKPDFVVRSEPNRESEGHGTLGRVLNENLRVEAVKGQPDWYKIQRPNGGDGYVFRGAVKAVQLKGNFILRTQPDVATGENKGHVRDAGNLVLTGKKKEFQADGRTHTWLEVIADGKHRWISGAAMVAKPETAPAKTTDAATTPSKSPPARAQAAGPAKAGDKVPPLPPKRPKDLPGSAKHESVHANKPIPATGSAHVSAPAATHPPAASHPAVAQGSKPAARETHASTKTEGTAAPSQAEKLPTCARNSTLLQQIPELKKFFGDRSPFVQWKSKTYGLDLTASESGSWNLHLPPLVAQLAKEPTDKEVKSDIPLPIQICIDRKENKPYMLVYDKRFNFNGDSGDSVILSYKDKQDEFRRVQGTAQ